MAFATRLTSKSLVSQEVYYPSEMTLSMGELSTHGAYHLYLIIEQRKATVRAVERELEEVDEIVGLFI